MKDILAKLGYTLDSWKVQAFLNSEVWIGNEDRITSVLTLCNRQPHSRTMLVEQAKIPRTSTYDLLHENGHALVKNGMIGEFEVKTGGKGRPKKYYYSTSPIGRRNKRLFLKSYSSSFPELNEDLQKDNQKAMLEYVTRLEEMLFTENRKGELVCKCCKRKVNKEEKIKIIKENY
jgi:hypothetical protein